MAAKTSIVLFKMNNRRNNMYLKSLTITNFRKFRRDNTTVLLAYDRLREQAEEKERKEINISPTSTLVVGKNNVGKTSVISALKKIAKEESFTASDFNFEYLNELINDYLTNGNLALPEINFKMDFIIDDKNDLITNIAPLLFLKDTESATLHIKIKLKEEEEYIRNLAELAVKDDSRKFKLLLEAIEDIGLEEIYYNNDMQEIKNFKIKDLIEIKPIEANKITLNNSLTQAFNKIIKYRYKRNKSIGITDVEGEIETINKTLTAQFQNDHALSVNESLSQIERSDKLSIKLSSDLTHDKLLQNNILVYEYVEKELAIPESQYGLGYTNLVMIIAEIIDYIERAPEDAFTSKINIITIEEPETYMHPQMQELFIKNINSAIAQLLESQNKYVNSQILITTHSSHILNSKIHSGNSFNYMNYLTEYNNHSQIINLQDDKLIAESSNGYGKSQQENSKEKYRKLEFLKKHIKYKVSELFFSDAIIFVEGVSEETLIKHYIDQNDELQKYYISIFNIDGAHGLVYHNLIMQLKVPALIITDIDIKNEEKTEEISDKEMDSNKEKSEKNIIKPITSLKGKKTTNQTIKHYFSEEIENIEQEDNQKEESLFVTFQKKIDSYYPTSFEEALILTNYNSEILKRALKDTKPRIYADNYNEKNEDLRDKSRFFQEKLSKSKSEFSNRILSELVNSNSNSDFRMPNYIKEGLNWLEDKLRGE